MSGDSDSASGASSSTFDFLCAAAENFCASAACGPCSNGFPCVGGSGQDAEDETLLDEILERETDAHGEGTAPGACQATSNDTDKGARRETADKDNCVGSNSQDDNCNSESDSNLRLESYNSLLTDDVQRNKPNSQHQRRHQSQPQYRGLENLGNTCYINSSLQVLMTLESFVDDVVSRTSTCGEMACGDAGSDGDDRDGAARGDDNNTLQSNRISTGTKNMVQLSQDVGSRGVVAEGRLRLPPASFAPTNIEEEEKKEDDLNDQQDNSDGDVSSPEKPLHVALGNVFTSLRKTGPCENSDATNGGYCVSQASMLRNGIEKSASAVNPSEFKSTVDSLSPQFAGSDQQDSHEFIGTLLDLLHEEVKARDKVARASSSASGEDVDNDTESEEGAQASPSIKQSPQKRKRNASPSPSLVSEDEDSDGMPRTRSFADLTMKGISSLLHEGDNSYSTDQIEKEQANADEMTAATDMKMISPVEAHFATEVRTTLRCNSCMFSRSRTELFRCLSLDVAASDTTGACPTSVDECLRRFFAPERRREVKCEKCFFDTATQTSEISKLPRALLLHFKRFIVDVSPDYTSVSYRKDARQVQFRDDIIADVDVEGATSLAEYLSSDCAIPANTGDNESPGMYRLRGIVNHIGKNANRGHYTAVTYTGAPRSGDKSLVYTKFNDERVIPISAEDATGEEAQSTAYILLYAL